MGIMLSFPFVLLIVYDFFLWIWRTIQKHASSKATTQRRDAVTGPSSSVRKPLSTKFD